MIWTKDKSKGVIKNNNYVNLFNWLTFSFVELLTTSISRGRVLVVAKYSIAGS